MKYTKRKIIAAGILSVLLAACASQAQPTTTYTSAELKKEQVMFTGYLDDAEKQLDGAKRRLDNNNCELAVASVILALGNKDLSKFKQYGHLDRIQSNSAGWVSTARKLTAKYNDEVVPKTQKTEEDIDQFIKAYFAKICPDLLRLIDSYKNMVKQLDPNDPNSAKKISDIMGTAEMGQGAQAIQEKINKNSGGADHTSTTGSDTQGMLDAVQNLNLPQATKDALTDAINHKDWAKALKLLKGCNTPECQKLREQILALLQANMQNWGVPQDQADKIAQLIRDGKFDEAAALLNNYDNPECKQFATGLKGRGPNDNSDSGKETDNGSSGKKLNGGKGTTSTDDVSTTKARPGEDIDESSWGDYDGNGERHRAVAHYPQGRDDGTLSKEIVQTQNRAGDKVPDEEISWGLIIKEEKGASKEQATYSVDNEEQTKEKYVITEWKLLKGNNTVSSEKGETFKVTYTDSGEYTVEADGHTDQYKFKFKIRKIVPYVKD